MKGLELSAGDFIALWSPRGELGQRVEASDADGGLSKSAASPEGVSDWEFRWWVLNADACKPPAVCRAVKSGGSALLFRGLLYRESDPLRWLERFPFGCRQRWATLLNETSGTFCGVVYDAAGDRLVLFTDGYAVERIYFSRCGSGWAISTDPFRLAALCNDWRLSRVAVGALLACGYLPGIALFWGQRVVAPGCLVELTRNAAREEEYWTEPETTLSRREQLPVLRSAHQDFWTTPVARRNSEPFFLLSGGRDSRLLLKFMLGAGLRPKAICYERAGNPVYPFISYLLEDTWDRQVAEKLAAETGIHLELLRIPNAHLLQHLEELVWLNHGGPLHWELHYIGSRLGAGSEPVVLGFEGDVIASLQEIQGDTAEAEAAFWLSRETDAVVYEQARLLFEEEPATREDLLGTVTEIFRLSRVRRKSARARWAFIRTRGVGRNVPTFQQIRPYRDAVYPYLDREVRKAYGMLSDRALAHRNVHTQLLLDGAVFARWPVSRSGLAVKAELRWGPLLRAVNHAFRRFRDSGYAGRRGWWGLRPEVRTAIERTWQELGGAEGEWRRWVEECGARRKFVEMAPYAIALVRIQRAVESLRRNLNSVIEKSGA